jgi:hypothetical protein
MRSRSNPPGIFSLHSPRTRKKQDADSSRERERMEGREEERKGSGGAATGVSTPGANLKDLVSREYYGHKKKVRSLTPPQYRRKEKPSK